MTPIDRLVAGLLILKKYSSHAEPLSSGSSRRSIRLQELEFELMTQADHERLMQLGWWTNGQLVWEF